MSQGSKLIRLPFPLLTCLALALVSTSVFAKSGEIKLAECPKVAQELPYTKWIKAEGKPKSITLVAHGLNLNPEKMNSISNIFHEQGSEVLGVSLSGHRGDEAEFKEVTRSNWIKELHASYCQARQRADELGVPLNFAGYSLGAALNIDLMNNFPEANVKYDRMVLFAPAAAVNFKSYLVKTLNILGSNFVVPSMGAESYRANCSGIPMAAFYSLFDSIKNIKKSGVKQSGTPTLILIDVDDEVVSSSGLKEIINTNELSDWGVYEFSKNKDQAPTVKTKHIMIDEESVGADEWAFMKKMINAHMATPRPSTSRTTPIN